MAGQTLPAHALRSEQRTLGLTPGQAEAWLAAAEAADMKPNDWIRRTCDAAAESEARARRRVALEEARVERAATNSSSDPVEP